jgi:hypothetical protein
MDKDLVATNEAEALMPLHLYRIDDGGERHWVSATRADEARATLLESDNTLDDEAKADLKIILVADDELVTAYDGATKETKTAAQWAAEGRGVIASTCE